MSLLIRASAKPTPTPNNVFSKKTTIKSPKLTPVERSNDFLSVAERVNGRAAIFR